MNDTLIDYLLQIAIRCVIYTAIQRRMAIQIVSTR